MNQWIHKLLYFSLTSAIILGLIMTLPSLLHTKTYAIGEKATVCDFVIANDELNKKCKECVVDQKKSWTAIGCIDSTSPAAFTNALINLGIGLGGGIAFLLILFGGFQVMTSAGNPDQLEAGKELVSAALAGLLMIIFSVFLLRIIGVDILGLPGFS